jgi:hypothetical protein
MLKNDEAFKIFSKLFFEKGLKYQVQTDYELLKLPKRLDVVVIKGGGNNEKRGICDRHCGEFAIFEEFRL